MSHISLTYHLVFGTYRRKLTIETTHERELYKFILDFSTCRGVKIRRIGGMPDHIHILCDIPATCTLSGFIKTLKGESSKFLRINSHFPLWEKWAEGYGAFTIGAERRETVRQYIMNQRLHHSKQDFSAEYRELLCIEGFPVDTPVLGDLYQQV